MSDGDVVLAPGGEEVLALCGRCNALIDALCDTHEPPGLGAAGRCPRCKSRGSHDFKVFESDDEDQSVWDVVTCLDCEYRWRNTFVLASQEEE